MFNVTENVYMWYILRGYVGLYSFAFQDKRERERDVKEGGRFVAGEVSKIVINVALILAFGFRWPFSFLSR